MNMKFLPSSPGLDSLILLPGLICDARIFEAQLSVFPNAIAVDAYGDAGTLEEMAAQVLRACPARFSLLGHSMGARVALEIVRAAPERVTRLALVSTGVHLPKPGEAEKRFALQALGQKEGMERLVDAWLPPMIGPKASANASVTERLRSMCIAAGLDTFSTQINALLNRPEVETLLARISIPTLIAVGADDVWSPPSQHAHIAAQMPNAHLVEISDAGHMLPVEAPSALNTAITQWLGS